jgi:hypothetical protein
MSTGTVSDPERVAVFARLMTDRCPPFRLDMGEDGPGSRSQTPRAGSES